VEIAHLRPHLPSPLVHALATPPSRSARFVRLLEVSTPFGLRVLLVTIVIASSENVIFCSQVRLPTEPAHQTYSGAALYSPAPSPTDGRATRGVCGPHGGAQGRGARCLAHARRRRWFSGRRYRTGAEVPAWLCGDGKPALAGAQAGQDRRVLLLRGGLLRWP
jgi:hypothetical protein